MWQLYKHSFGFLTDHFLQGSQNFVKYVERVIHKHSTTYEICIYFFALRTKSFRSFSGKDSAGLCEKHSKCPEIHIRVSKQRDFNHYESAKQRRKKRINWGNDYLSALYFTIKNYSRDIFRQWVYKIRRLSTQQLTVTKKFTRKKLPTETFMIDFQLVISGKNVLEYRDP